MSMVEVIQVDSNHSAGYIQAQIDDCVFYHCGKVIGINTIQQSDNKFLIILVFSEK